MVISRYVPHIYRIAVYMSFGQRERLISGGRAFDDFNADYGDFLVDAVRYESDEASKGRIWGAEAWDEAWEWRVLSQEVGGGWK